MAQTRQSKTRKNRLQRAAVIHIPPQIFKIRVGVPGARPNYHRGVSLSAGRSVGGGEVLNALPEGNGFNDAIAALKALAETAVSSAKATKSAVPVAPAAAGKRVVSPEALQRMAEAQQKRWAKKKRAVKTADAQASHSTVWAPMGSGAGTHIGESRRTEQCLFPYPTAPAAKRFSYREFCQNAFTYRTSPLPHNAPRQK